MTEDEKGETIRAHLSLTVQYLLPSYAIALPLGGGWRAAPGGVKEASFHAGC
jgi:hypothetical protein